jgi:hypothetical protein
MSLIQFAKNYTPRTDKYDLGYINEFYHQLFEPRRFKIDNLLEIGVYYGASILLWKDYFYNSIITGVDINECSAVKNHERINHILGNAYSLDFVEKFTDKSFDIIIDDGPHTYESMVFFLTHYIKKVKSGGLLILEDIIDPKWTPNLLSLIDSNIGKITVHHMGNKVLDPQLRTRWEKNGLDVIVVEIF